MRGKRKWKKIAVLFIKLELELFDPSKHIRYQQQKWCILLASNDKSRKPSYRLDLKRYSFSLLRVSSRRTVRVRLYSIGKLLWIYRQNANKHIDT